MVFSSYAAFQNITGHRFLENRGINITLLFTRNHKQYFISPKNIILTLYYFYVSEIFSQYSFHNLLYIQILLHRVFCFFSTQVLYTIFDNLQKKIISP